MFSVQLKSDSCIEICHDWRVHQTHSHKNAISSDNWSSRNAHISLVKAGPLLEYQLKIAQFNIACKCVDGFLWPLLVSHWFSELETSDRILAKTSVGFCDVINIFEFFWGGVF